MSTFGNGIEIFNKNTPGSGSLVNANSGVGLDGTGTIVQLGINPLLQLTQIDLNGNGFWLIDTGGVGNIRNILSNLGDPFNPFYTQFTQNAISGFTQILSNDGNVTQWGIEQTFANGFIIRCAADAPGMGYSNSLGLAAGLAKYGTGYIPCVADLKDTAPFKIAQAELANQSASVNLLTMNFAVIEAGADICIRISSYLHVSSVTGGSVKLSITFTNMSNVVTTLDLTPLFALTGDLAVNPITIKVLRNTTTTINSVATANIQFDMGTYVERLFIF